MIESVLERFRRVFRRGSILPLIKEIPTGHRDNQTTCDLHDKKRDAEEGQNFAAENAEIRSGANP